MPRASSKGRRSGRQTSTTPLPAGLVYRESRTAARSRSHFQGKVIVSLHVLEGVFFFFFKHKSIRQRRNTSQKRINCRTRLALIGRAVAKIDGTKTKHTYFVLADDSLEIILRPHPAT